MTPGDRPGLPLTSEPAPYLHADRITTPVVIGRQPVDHHLPLEAEPALWPSLSGGSTTEERGDRRGRPAPPPAPPRSPLPATGATLPTWAGGLAIVAAAILRRRDG